MATVTKRHWTTKKGERTSAFQVSWHDRLGNRHKRQFKTKAGADRFRIEMEGKVQAGTFRAAANRLTVKEAMQAFFVRCEERHRAGEKMTRHNLEVYKGHVFNHILNPGFGLGAVQLGQLTAGIIDGWSKDLRDRGGVSVQTRKKVLATLRVALEHCITNDWIAANPARNVTVITPRGQESRKIVPPSKNDIKRLLAAAESDPNFYVELIFSSLSGARAGEQRALRWRDIDSTAGGIKITRSVDRFKVEQPPKTEAGNRTVPMSDLLKRKMQEFRLRSHFSKDDDLVFPSATGGFADHDNMIKRKFLPAVERAGIPRINWHALRHYAVSTWIEQGMSPKEIQTFAGHSTLQVTMDRYGHLFPKTDHIQKFNAVAKDLL